MGPVKPPPGGPWTQTSNGTHDGPHSAPLTRGSSLPRGAGHEGRPPVNYFRLKNFRREVLVISLSIIGQCNFHNLEVRDTPSRSCEYRMLGYIAITLIKMA